MRILRGYGNWIGADTNSVGAPRRISIRSDAPRIGGSPVYAITSRKLPVNADGCLYPGRTARFGVRGELERIMELGEGRGASGGTGNGPVGEPGVLGQQRSMHVCADHGPPADPFEPVAPVVAVPTHDPAEGLRRCAQVGAAAV